VIAKNGAANPHLARPTCEFDAAATEFDAPATELDAPASEFDAAAMSARLGSLSRTSNPVV